MAYSPLPPLGQTGKTSSLPVAIATDQSGQQPAAASISVALANENLQDLSVTGTTGQAALGVNILLTPSATTSFDSLSGITYRSFYCQVIGTAGIASGQIIFEGSNDNATFNPLTVYDDSIVTAVPINAAFSIAASTNRYFSGKLSYRFIRCRISTVFVGGTIQAITKYSPIDYVPRILTVGQATAANLNVTVGSGTLTTVTTVGTVTTVAAMTSGNLGIPGIIADQVSAAITGTTTGATLTPTFGPSYMVSMPVTVVTGTGSTLDLQIQESDDTGTNWFPVYDFPRITATGIYRSPKLPLRGNRLRYIHTITGTTPSFTRSINRLQSSDAVNGSLSQQIDRTIVLTSATGITPSLNIQNAKNAQMVVNIGTATTVPVLQMQGSDDAGTSWYSVGSVLSATTASTVQVTVNNVNSQLLRASVTVSGSGVVAGYVLLKGF